MSPKFTTSILLTLVLTACGGGGGGGSTNTVMPAGVDISTYASADVSRDLSIIGNWNINMYRLKTGTPTDPVDFYNIVRLGSSQAEEIGRAHV